MIMRISNGMDFWWKQPREREKKKSLKKRTSWIRKKQLWVNGA